MVTDLPDILIQFQDYLAPKLDTYEQALYLYIFRHSRLLGLEEVTIGFKSARSRMATGIGERGRPMSENTAYEKIASLQSKGCIDVVSTHHKGRLLRLKLPNEIPGVVPSEAPNTVPELEEMDFFGVPEYRLLLLEREGYRCFYTFEQLTESNFVVEHVLSRPVGDNSYRNCVASSREANNRKGAQSAEDFLRKLFREQYLNEAEFVDRMNALTKLKAGELKPRLTGSCSVESAIAPTTGPAIQPRSRTRVLGDK